MGCICEAISGWVVTNELWIQQILPVQYGQLVGLFLLHLLYTAASHSCIQPLEHVFEQYHQTFLSQPDVIWLG